jgi:hypothetical protein
LDQIFTALPKAPLICSDDMSEGSVVETFTGTEVTAGEGVAVFFFWDATAATSDVFLDLTAAVLGSGLDAGAVLDVGAVLDMGAGFNERACLDVGAATDDALDAAVALDVASCACFFATHFEQRRVFSGGPIH